MVDRLQNPHENEIVLDKSEAYFTVVYTQIRDSDLWINVGFSAFLQENILRVKHILVIFLSFLIPHKAVCSFLFIFVAFVQNIFREKSSPDVSFCSARSSNIIRAYSALFACIQLCSQNLI